MKSLSFTSQNAACIENGIQKQSLSSTLNGITKSIIYAIKFIMAEISAMVNRFISPVNTLDTYKTFNVKHVQNSCRKMKEPERRIFFLYVKGYSINEIASVSGAKHHNIIMTVHNTLKNIHKETVLS